MNSANLNLNHQSWSTSLAHQGRLYSEFILIWLFADHPVSLSSPHCEFHRGTLSPGDENSGRGSRLPRANDSESKPFRPNGKRRGVTRRRCTYGGSHSRRSHCLEQRMRTPQPEPLAFESNSNSGACLLVTGFSAYFLTALFPPQRK